MKGLQKFQALLLITMGLMNGNAQNAPVFGSEIPVTINGLTFDVMEPALSSDGNTLFFNSLNDAVTTSLYYATRVNDSTFTFGAALSGANQTVTPRLDAVASADSAGNFYWTSLRDFPTQQETCFHGKFNGNNVVNLGRVHGDFNMMSQGWLMMDASVNHTGDLLYFTNAYFGPNYAGCNGTPCKTKMGIALKLNDSTFNKIPLSDTLLKNVNDTNYAVYAPHVTKDGLELYYSRFLRANLSQGTQNCVSVRTSTNQPFGVPHVLHPFSVMVPEAACLDQTGNKMYFHRKTGNLFKLFLRYRLNPVGVPEPDSHINAKIFPNPSNGIISVMMPGVEKVNLELYSIRGELILKDKSDFIDLSLYEGNVFYLRIFYGKQIFLEKVLRVTQ